MYFKFILLFCLTITLLLSSCTSTETTANLVQPENWWSVHPRPVYATLEHVGCFQNWFEVYKINDATYAIYEPYQFEEALCYLVEGRNRAAVIDTGTGIGNLRQLIDELTNLPTFVILTHEHYDHVADAWQWDHVAVFDNPAALAVLKAGRSNESLQGYLAADYLWQKSLPADFDPATWTIPSIEPIHLLEEGDIIDLGDRPLEVICTPGHSPGQICLLDKKYRLLFTGDHFFPGPLYAFGPDVNLDHYVASNQKLTARLDEFDYLCAGHNDPYVKADVLPRVSAAFDTVRAGGGQYNQDPTGLRRYQFNGFDVLIRKNMIK